MLRSGANVLDPEAQCNLDRHTIVVDDSFAFVYVPIAYMCTYVCSRCDI